MRAAAVLLLAAGAAAQEACRFCPLDPAAAAPSCSAAPATSSCTNVAIQSDANAQAFLDAGCTVVGVLLTAVLLGAACAYVVRQLRALHRDVGVLVD